MPATYRIPGYADLLRAAERGAWDAAAIDLTADAAAWRALPAAERAKLAQLLGGFLLGEEGVARDIVPFAARAAEPAAAACLAAQRRDEDRHARALQRVEREVARAPLAPPAALRPPFDDELPALAAALRDGRTALPDAVALYHGVIEGAIFLAGQDELLERLPDALPGTREVISRVQRDERWHVGLGVRLLVDAGYDDGERLLARGARALDGWGALLRPEIRARTLTALARRLRVSGLLAARPG